MKLRTLFGLNLKRHRKKKRLSQEELSDRVGISAKHLSKIERGLTFVSADLLEKLALNLEIPVAHLFCKENEKVYDDTMLNVFDRITETHLIRAMDGIKADIRRDSTL